MKNYFLLGLLLALFSCQTQTEKPQVEVPAATLKEITDFAASSKCAQYSFKQRGKMPAGYIKGLALMYAKEVCAPNKTVSATSYQAPKDALEWYSLKPNKLSTYTLLLGLGMRESSGKYCEGRDASASNVSANEAEAGMFQASFNSAYFNAELKTLQTSKCYLEIFSEGVTCKSSDAKNWGTGAGRDWQEKMKSCPAYAVEWNAMLIRNAYHHFGPLKRKEAEYRKECEEMFMGIEERVNKNKQICGEL